jgi:hypothetical protein
MMYRIDACPATPSRELRPDTRATEFAADSLLVDAVSSEPVSRSNSLLTGKFTGNFALERAFASSLTARIGLRPGHFSTRELEQARNLTGNCRAGIRELSEGIREYIGGIREPVD